MEKQIEVVAALIWREDRFLLCQRPEHKARGLQWEFVGGKVEPGETKQQALVRECREELDVTVSVGRELMQVIHSYPDITIHLTVFFCSIVDGVPKLLEHRDMRWVSPAEAGQFDLCPVDREILEEIQKEHSDGSRIGS